MDSINKQILKAVDTRKGDVADAIGMPDQKDLDTLKKIINDFEKEFPGEIRGVLDQARREFAQGVHGKNLYRRGDAVINADSKMTYALELPPKLYERIEKVFPSVFKSKKHLNWFKESFNKLTVSL